MNRIVYQVTKDGKDIHGAHWATKDIAVFTLKVEADNDYENLKKGDDDDKYSMWYGEGYESADIYEEKWTNEYTVYRTKIHNYAIREVKIEVGEKKKAGVYEVEYFRTKAHVTDIRYFKSLEELSEWFTRQNRDYEPTMIIRIEAAS